MGDVVELDEHRPHVAGRAVCEACRHEWEAVAPVAPGSGFVFLECPKCGTNMGRFKNVHEPDDALVWRCDCGCTVFQRFKVASGEGWMCVNCGKWANP